MLYALATNECLTDFYDRWYDIELIKDGTERFKRESRANRERSRRCNSDLTAGGVSFFGISRDGKRAWKIPIQRPARG
jgi:hypothetical protein